ncbi:MAG TPA: type II CAAX endopeptidase family protein, partial [Phycisphaerales bacterium]|nr:type II CAAX endopeptidase family protein [Phycisphaerales bacterium]
MNPNEPHPAEPAAATSMPFLETDPSGDGRRDPGGAKLFMTWVVLIVAALLMFLPANLPAPPRAPSKPEESQSWQVQVFARYLIGAKQITPQADQLVEYVHKGIDDRKINPTDAAAKRDLDLDRLRATVIVGELEDGEAAVQRLDALGAEPSFDPELKPDLDAFRAAYSESAGDTANAAGTALTDDQRALLKKNHAWFGELAATYGLPDTDPAREAALAPCTRTIVAVFAAVVVAGLALLAGLVLFVTAIILGVTGKLHGRFQRDMGLTEKERRVLLETPAVLMLSLVGLHALLDSFSKSANPTLQSVAGFGLVFQLMLAVVILWPLVRGMSWTTLRKANGWHAGRGVFREIGAGVVGYLAGLPIVVVGLISALCLLAIQSAITNTTASPSHPIVEHAGSGGVLGALMLYVLASGWAPLVEESTFRGAFFRHLRWVSGPVVSGLIVGFFFAAIHPQGWAIIPAL